MITTLIVATFLITLIGVVQEAVRQGLNLVPMLRLIPFALLNALVFALPAALLLSVCSVFGRMSANNELIAIKSLGIPPSAVIRPALWLSLFLSVVAVAIIDVAFSKGYDGIQQVVRDSVAEITYSVLRTHRTYANKQFSISVARVDGQKLIHPTIVLHRPQDGDVTMSAREAELRVSAGDGDLVLSLTDGCVQIGNRAAVWFPDTVEQIISLRGEGEGQGLSKSPSHLALHEIAAATKAQQDEIRALQMDLAVEAAGAMMFGDMEELQGPPWTARYSGLAGALQRLRRLEAEPFRRWASGFSCLAFVTLGIPLAIRWKNADLMTTFFICFLPILLLYYPLFAIGLDSAKSGSLPPYFVWLGNLICFALGAWQLRYVRRY